MKEIINYPAEHYLELIRENIPFQLSRFGDGEVIAMKFKEHPLRQNCDGSAFLPELVQPLKQIFINNYNYYHCVLDCTFNENGEQFKQFIEETCPNMQFYNGEIWQHLSFDGRIRELIDAISPYNPCFVGGKHIRKVQYMMGIDNIMVIETPSRDSFKEFNRICDDIMKLHFEGCRMFLFAAGYTSKILIDTMFPYMGHDTFLIDCGSLFDPYCNKFSRDGMKFVGKSFFQPYTNLILR